MTATKPFPHASTAIKAQIDENLKRVYNQALNEDVPDRFKDLLAKLRANEESKVSEEPPA